MCCLLVFLSVPSELWWPWLLRCAMASLLMAFLSEPQRRRRHEQRQWVPRLTRRFIDVPSIGIRSCGRKKPEWVAREVMRLAMFLRGCRTVAAHFNALHGQRMTVGHDYVARLLREHADELRFQRRGMRQAVPRMVPMGRAWSLDLSQLDVAGERCLILGLLDQGSRMALRLKVLAHKSRGRCSPSCARRSASTACRDRFAPTTEPCSRAGYGTLLSGVLGSAASEYECAARGRTDASSASSARSSRHWPRSACRAPPRCKVRLTTLCSSTSTCGSTKDSGGLTPAQAWRGLTLSAVRRCAGAPVRRCAGRGQWTSALQGHLIGYRLRC